MRTARTEPEPPADFSADLAALRHRPELGESLWRHPALAWRLYTPAIDFALRALPRPSRVLDVGAGFGSVALELARAGHAVVALEPASEACAVARRTLSGSSAGLIEGELGRDGLEPGSVDAVRFGRSLHHIADLDAACARAAELLRGDGVLILDEYCAEQVVGETALWLAEHARRAVETGAARPSGIETVADVEVTWAELRRDHGLRTFDEMSRALRSRFDLGEATWYPYLWYKVAVAVPDPADADRVAGAVEGDENQLIRAGKLPGVAFRALARPRPGGA